MTETLRLAFVSPHHPSETSWGLTHVLSSISRLMAREGHEVDVYYPVKGSQLPPPDVWEGVRAIPVGWSRAARLPFGPDMEFSWRVARALPPGLDVVMAHNENGGAFVMRRVRQMRRSGSGRSPVAVHAFHGVGLRFLEMGRARRPRQLRPRLGYFSDWLALRWFEGGGARSADACVACSAAIGEELQQIYRIPDRRIRVIYNGVEPERAVTPEERAEARRSLGLADDTSVLSFVGQDTHRKGLDVATRAVSLLVRQGRKVVLLNVGNSTPSTDQVHSFGIVDAPTKRRILVASDVFFLPTRYEGLPLVVQEAAALGLPVVTTAAAHVEWGTPGRDFVLVSPNTPEAAAEALAPLLGSEEARHALAEGGRRELGSRRYDVQAREYLALFRELLAGTAA
jgi:glycosyltransferase involved in cell wall biosynthesis